MHSDTPIYGHSRGYRALAALALVALLISLRQLTQSSAPAGIAGTVGFGLLFWYAVVRSFRRVVVLEICESGFRITDPAVPVGLVAYEAIEEMRLLATLDHPTVSFRFVDHLEVRRRAPTVVRFILKPVWSMQHYQITVQLDELNDQVAAIKSTALRHGIPLSTELL